jgi:hypothetical protein
MRLLICDCDLIIWCLISDIPDMQCDAQSVWQLTYRGLYYEAPIRILDLSVKGQRGDQDITKNCIVCMMRLTW